MMVDAQQAGLPAVAVELPDMYADPRFNAPASGDYRLSAFSLALVFSGARCLLNSLCMNYCHTS